jgi:hypothetical protein
MSIPWRKQRNTVLFPHRCIPNPTPSALAQHHLVFISVSPIEPSQPQEIPPTTSYCIVLRQTPPNTSNTAFLPRSRRMHFLQKSPKPVSFVFFALIFKHVTNKRMEEYFVLTDGILESRVIFGFRCWNTTGIPGIWRKHYKKQQKCTVTFNFPSYH